MAVVWVRRGFWLRGPVRPSLELNFGNEGIHSSVPGFSQSRVLPGTRSWSLVQDCRDPSIQHAGGMIWDCLQNMQMWS
ncbi:hypothetical protein F751_6585 [Auxenochlorella protothecoides]|uniref:Uncharacterized protein n=1 Tax=Auxenochlorella protothecoides TaxID=3075 RepID=A0A087SPF0_AUXPR|nr:hypothetical protein F751_6585 [Auxenochlorella protothecoides]KFM27604.1 hypothetical protein F751_6585 [Auxenochlorella protothecoides]